MATPSSHDVYFVKIDLRKLQSTLMRAPAPGGQDGGGDSADSGEWINEGVFDWLLDNGFRIGQQGWYADAETLQKLEPSAIISREPVSGVPN